MATKAKSAKKEAKASGPTRAQKHAAMKPYRKVLKEVRAKFAAEKAAEFDRFREALFGIILFDAIESGELKSQILPHRIGSLKDRDGPVGKVLDRLFDNWLDTGLNDRKKFRLEDLHHVAHLLQPEAAKVEGK
jgi:hypothetical protein